MKGGIGNLMKQANLGPVGNSIAGLLGGGIGQRAHRGEVAALRVAGLHDRVGGFAGREEARHRQRATEALGAHGGEVGLLARVSRRLGRQP